MSTSTKLLQVAAELAECLDDMGIYLAAGEDRRYGGIGRDWSRIDCDTDEMEIVVRFRGEAAELLVRELRS